MSAPPGTLWKLVKQMERATAKLEGFADDMLDVKARLARVERMVWMGLGAVVLLQLIMGAVR